MNVFITKYNRRCVRWWGPGSPEAEDAFQTSWSQEVLWVNPTYAKLPEVVEKCRQDGAHAVLVAPLWPRKRWFRAACAMSLEKIVYPRGTRIFERDGQACYCPMSRGSVFVVRA